MAGKIIIDAGHGGSDPGAAVNGRQEKDDNLKLALAVGKILEQKGVDVIYTRTDDLYDTPFQKAQKANLEGADFLVSFHRNSSPQDNQYSGVETLIYDKSGKKLKLAENINEALETVGFRNLGVKERPNLVILKRTKMPAVLVETGFLNTESDNRLFDERFAEMAEAIAAGILDTLEEKTDSNQYYRVQTGAFRRREYAEEQLYSLLQQGFPAFLLKEGEYYKVQVGAFRHLDYAVKLENTLRKNGYSTMIIHD